MKCIIYDFTDGLFVPWALPSLRSPYNGPKGLEATPEPAYQSCTHCSTLYRGAHTCPPSAIKPAANVRQLRIASGSDRR